MEATELNAHMQKLQRAVNLFNQGEYVQVEPICRELIAEIPDDHQALRLLGASLRFLDQFEESMELLERAVAIRPRHDIYHFELGVTYKMADRLQEASACFYKCLEITPGFWRAISNIGSILDGFGRHQEAIEWALRAQRLAPDNASCHYNVGNAQLGLGHVDSAILSFNRTLEIDPDYAKAHWNLAICHLFKGNFRLGWESHEWRENSGQVQFDKYPQPRWNGEDIRNKTLLIHAEQGIGDETLFASCFPDAIERAGECVITCDKRLSELFIRSFPRAMVYGITRRSNQQPADLPEQIDYQSPAGSLPRFFRNEWSDFPDRRSYLIADTKKTAMWRERFDALGPGLKIGISWRTGGMPASRRLRTTSLAQWRHLFAMPGAQWINLQYGDVSDDLATEQQQSGTVIHDWEDGDPLTDLDGFAARLSALDLVISTGNATAHMAGALGVESWVLLPKIPTWRWLLSGERIPWYSSVKAMRQLDAGDWSPVFRELGNMLSARLGIDAPQEWSLLSEVSDEEIDFVGPDGVPLTKDSVLAYCQRANQLQKEDKFEEAEAICQLILKHFPRDHSATQMIAVIALRTGRPEMAVRHLRRLLQVLPHDPLAHLSIANAYRKLDKLEPAIEHYRKAILLKPESTDAYINLGVTYKLAGQLDLARQMYEEALRIDPSLEVAQKNLAKLDDSRTSPHFPSVAATPQGDTAASPSQPSLDSPARTIGRAAGVEALGGPAEGSLPRRATR